MTIDAAKVAAARLWAATRMPYLASAIFACTVREARDTGAVRATSGWVVEADPDVIDVLDAAELGRLLVHLTGHLVRDHAARARAAGVDRGSRSWWRRCADAELNDDLRADDCVPTLAPDLPVDLGCADGGLAESYFATHPPRPQPGNCGSACDGLGADDGLPPEQAELVRLGVAAQIEQASGREPGTVPAGWIRWAERILPAKVDWRRVLAAEVRFALASVCGNVDYTYARPSRRASLRTGVVMPAMHHPVPHVAIVCDTSGSMHEGLLERALAEVEGLLVRAGLRAGEVRVLAVDTAVHAVSRPRRARDVELLGGGGTDMGAGLAAAARLQPRPAVTIVLTDGFTPWPPAPQPRMRVVVGVLTEPGAPPHDVPPWARVVLIDR